MNNNVKSPCYWCEERTIYCHTNCEKYIEFQKINQMLRDSRNRETQKNFDKFYYLYRKKR